MDPLNTVIVGCGAVAQRLYRKPLQRLEKQGILSVRALVDPVVVHAEALAAFFPRAHLYADLEQALTTSHPVLALILTPAHLHCAQTIMALKHHSHALCEKPMANTVADCAAMNALALANNRVLAVGMIRRFFPAFSQLKQLIAAGTLGSPLSFEYREGHKFEWDVTTDAAFRPRAFGGTGVLFDIGPHVIDHLAWTFGELRVTDYSDDAMKGIESNAFMNVETATCPGSIHLSWDTPQSNELRVFGSKRDAVLRIDQFGQLALSGPAGYDPQHISVRFPADVDRIPRSYLSPRNYAEAVYCQLVQTARAILHGEPPAVDGDSGQAAVSVLESALSIATPLDMPWLDSGERDALARMHWKGGQ